VPSANELRQRLGLSNAKNVNEGLTETLLFFERVIKHDPFEWLHYLRGIDFSHAVFALPLPPGMTLVRYETIGPKEVQKLPPFAFFTDPGVSPFHTGTSWPRWQFRKYTVRDETEALVSTASSISFSPTDRVSRIGGAPQYIISRADWPQLVYIGEMKQAT
jgi:hypothetical protein